VVKFVKFVKLLVCYCPVDY